MSAMGRAPHENVATVLVDPTALRDLEVRLMSLDMRVWPIATSTGWGDGPRTAFQVRRRMIMARRGAWDDAAEWEPVWISFGDSWRSGAEPLPWEAHKVLWETLGHFGEHVRYRLGLAGVPKLQIPQERTA
jgi:hypothetical protein